MSEEMKRGYSAEFHEYRNGTEAKYISIHDLIYSIMESSKPEQVKALIEMIVGQPAFADCVTELLKGYNDHDCSDHRPDSCSALLYQALLPNMELAAQKLVAKVLQENAQLRDQIQVKIEHTKKLLEDWPESYKKYIPKEAYSYSYLMIYDHEAQKLIDLAKTAKLEGINF